jgi:alanine racemase
MEFETPTRLEIRLDHFTHNVNLIQQHVGSAEVMPVIKANAYGHGMLRIAQHLESIGIKQIAVAFLREGRALRKAGIKIPILVLGGVFEEYLEELLEYNLEITIPSVHILQKLDELCRKKNRQATVHLKVDTGMERLGVRYPEAPLFIETALRSKHIQIKGVCSHFAVSDEPENPITKLQIERFEEAVDTFHRLSEPMPIRHIANSGGILHFPEAHYEMVRPGIIFYGCYPDPASQRVLDLKAPLSLKSRVVLAKNVPAFHPVSYGATWKSESEAQIATIPVGYGDGFRRDLSNKGSVLIQGKRYPIAGRVCMDQFMVKITDTKIQEGDEVTLIGTDGNEQISAEEIAGLIGTIPYEVLTGLNDRLPRTYI